MGALLGDAIGATLEFYFKAIGKREVNKAFELPGGGAHNVGPEQITDDGELTMCLLHALSRGEGSLDIKEVVKFYAKWIKSKPFDIGATTRASLFKADVNNPNPEFLYKAAEGKKS